MITIFLAMALQADAAAQAEGWAKKAKTIARCSSTVECDEKWKRASQWVRANTRFQFAVDRDDMLATYGAIYANTDLSFVLVKRSTPGGGTEIAARAWCGNVITCKPKPAAAIEALKREIG